MGKYFRCETKLELLKDDEARYGVSSFDLPYLIEYYGLEAIKAYIGGDR